MSKKKFNFDITTEESAIEIEKQTEVVVEQDVKEVDVNHVVELHLNVYLKPTTKELLLKAANQHKDKVVRLCQYANLSESALLGYIKQLG